MRRRYPALTSSHGGKTCEYRAPVRTTGRIDEPVCRRRSACAEGSLPGPREWPDSGPVAVVRGIGGKPAGEVIAQHEANRVGFEDPRPVRAPRLGPAAAGNGAGRRGSNRSNAGRRHPRGRIGRVAATMSSVGCRIARPSSGPLVWRAATRVWRSGVTEKPVSVIERCEDSLGQDLVRRFSAISSSATEHVDRHRVVPARSRLEQERELGKPVARIGEREVRLRRDSEASLMVETFHVIAFEAGVGQSARVSEQVPDAHGLGRRP